MMVTAPSTPQEDEKQRCATLEPWDDSGCLVSHIQVALSTNLCTLKFLPTLKQCVTLNVLVKKFMICSLVFRAQMSVALTTWNDCPPLYKTIYF